MQSSKKLRSGDLMDPEHVVRMIPPKRSTAASWLIVLIAIGLLVAALIFPFPVDGRFWGAIFDFAHCPAFFVALIGLVALLHPRAAGFSQLRRPALQMTFPLCIIAGVALFVIGGASEFMQQFAGRNSSWTDLAANGLGIMAGLCWLAGVAFDRRRLAAAIAAMIILFAAAKPVMHIAASVRQMQSFPQLASFESTLELGSWRPVSSRLSITEEWQSHGASSLQMELSNADYSGALMDWFETDWSEWKFLEFDVQNPESTPTTLTLKIADRRHNQQGHAVGLRFETPITIEAQSERPIRLDLNNVSSAPEEGTMNMSKIVLLEFFTMKKAAGERLRIDHVRLTR